MVTSDNNSTQENNDREVRQSRSSLIVKMPLHVGRKKRRLGVLVKPTRVKRSNNISLQKPRCYDSVESDNKDAIPNDDTSIDENTLEENEIAEIIFILERARSRSYGIEDNENTYPESPPNSNVKKTHQKKIPEKYY